MRTRMVKCLHVDYKCALRHTLVLHKCTRIGGEGRGADEAVGVQAAEQCRNLRTRRGVDGAYKPASQKWGSALWSQSWSRISTEAAGRSPRDASSMVTDTPLAVVMRRRPVAHLWPSSGAWHAIALHRQGWHTGCQAPNDALRPTKCATSRLPARRPRGGKNRCVQDAVTHWFAPLLADLLGHGPSTQHLPLCRRWRGHPSTTRICAKWGLSPRLCCRQSTFVAPLHP